MNAKRAFGACPRSREFWAENPDIWPVSSLTLGGESYTKAELVTLLEAPTEADASMVLAHEYITARINQAHGTSTLGNEGLFAEAENLLREAGTRLPQGVDPSSPTGSAMLAIASELARFNRGELSRGCTPS